MYDFTRIFAIFRRAAHKEKAVFAIFMVPMRPRMFLNCTKILCKLNFVKLKSILHNLCRNFAIICIKPSLLASKSVFLKLNYCK